ncbi:dTMP kinase [Haloglycomyces albus]|uniref:dTMP kinase n=1 Tax=Haloglycomyces albus TaxID=526067 RepID=UPI00046CBF5B|nr:dTMP kinase [Haloglycomyces albus]
MANAAADLRTVIRIGPFRKLWTVLGLASFGDWLGLFATAGFAQSLFDDPTAKGLAFAGVIVLRLLPSLVFGPIAGVLADRFDRRITMSTCDVLRFLLIASTPTVYVLTENVAFTMVWLGVAQILIELVVMAWMPAKEASIPNLLPHSKLETANQLTLATTYGLAPPLAFGVLALLERGASQWSAWGMFGEPMVLALYIDAAMFLIAAVTVFFFIPEISGRDRQETPKPQSMWRDFVDGLGYLRGHELVRGLIIGILGAFSGAGILIGVGQTYAIDLGGGGAAFNTLAAVLFIGLGSGIVFGPKLVGSLSRPRWFAVSIMVAALGLVADALAPILHLGLIGSFVIGLGAGMAFLAGITLLQREVHDDVRGRMFSFIAISARVVLMAAMVISAPLAGWATTWLSYGYISPSRVLLLVAALLVGILGVYAFRRMDDKPGVNLFGDLWRSITRKDSAPTGSANAPGVFIVFEGGEGSGKTTQVLKLVAWFKQSGYDVVHTREPGGTQLGSRIRSLILDAKNSDAPSDRAEALLYAADRAHHVNTVIKPALAEGKVVISDRYLDSSIAYQGAGRGLGADDIAGLSKWATDGLTPDLTILLDVDPAVGVARAKGDSTGDRIEQETVDFHTTVRESFLALARKRPGRYLVVPVTGDPGAIADDILNDVRQRLNMEQLRRAGQSDWPDLDSSFSTPNNGSRSNGTRHSPHERDGDVKATTMTYDGTDH